MKKYLAGLMVVFSLIAVGCGKGATGFDKPEDLGAKIADIQNNVDMVDILDLTTLLRLRTERK